MPTRRKRRPDGFGLRMERLSQAVMAWTGSTPAIVCAAATILVWLLLGPVFHFSDTWQLVINTGTTIVTFLMVFMIQRAQNKDARAVALKLDELIAAMEGASNRLIDVEALSEAELDVLHHHYEELVASAKSESAITESHSVEEAARRHRAKYPARRAG